ncbi:MAG: LysM peptidoglycan-binding domain-containing protein [Pontiellaceae bacterium]|nr:LysM peptidoglycan-binding domain-containing protein [Pontiellaceae bacterium]MBN2786365.1 LysM peptidoglycan-binding domain-containing protein [Pontiellaceae bacterium]
MLKIKFITVALVAVAILSGCDDKGLSLDEKEDKDPLIKTGLAYMEQGAWKDAESTFKEALDKDPLLAKPHLELAQIYQQYIPNYVHAIYHYDRYLELRPESEKAELIQKQKQEIMRAFAVKAISDSPEVKKALQKLQQENTTLRQQLTAARQATATPAPTTTAPASTVTRRVSQPAPVEATPAAATQTTASHKIYSVMKGDTLSKIATKFYGDSSKSDIIYDANRDSLANPNALRIGQTLVIPVLGN